MPLKEDDEYNFKQLHIPILNTQEEFDHLVLSLVKTIIDSLNERKILEHIKNTNDLKGSISKLERWFDELSLPAFTDQIKFLRQLQELRSTGTGHRKGKSYTKISNELGLLDNNFNDVFDLLLQKSCEFIEYIRSSLL